ncbi:MAG: T9SS type A sorting domain-containing protein [Fluviicola sp.]|nr:T9SS type A sorting domain-containing protein [Fluviicola sp.]
MLFRIKFIYLKVFICLQTCLISMNSFAQPTEVYSQTNRVDRLLDVEQLDDSTLVGVLNNFPVPLNLNFTNSSDSIINQYFLFNLYTKHIKYIPLIGNVDSIEVLNLGSSFKIDNDFYFTTRKISRTDSVQLINIDNIPSNSYRTLYKKDGDTIEKITNFHIDIPGKDYNSFAFKNLNDNYISLFSINASSFYLIEYDINGIEIQRSNLISNAYNVKGIIQNPVDSTYMIFHSLNKVNKTDKNFNTIFSNISLKEQVTNRYFYFHYFKSEIDLNPIISGNLDPNANLDTLFLATVTIVNDSTVYAKTKKFIGLRTDDFSPDPEVNFNFIDGEFQNGNYYRAYSTEFCLLGVPNCTSKFRVFKQDSLNNIHWEKEFGGDAGYFQAKTLGLKDGSCIVFVLRTNSSTGDIDMHYVYINKDGDIVPGFLDVLGLDELEIPMKETFSVFPNPANATLSINNQKLENKAVQLMISDLSGKLVIEQAFEKTIDISGLEQGTYLYSVKDINGQISSTKFVKTDQ